RRSALAAPHVRHARRTGVLMGMGSSRRSWNETQEQLILGRAQGEGVRHWLLAGGTTATWAAARNLPGHNPADLRGSCRVERFERRSRPGTQPRLGWRPAPPGRTSPVHDEGGAARHADEGIL